MTFLKNASDHPDDVVCANCISVLEGEYPGILLDQGFVSGQRAGICAPCIDLLLAALESED